MAKPRKAQTYPRVQIRIDKGKDRIWLLVTKRKGALQTAVGAVDGPLARTFSEIAATWFKLGFNAASTM